MYKIYVDATCEGWQHTHGAAKGKIVIKTPQQIFEEELVITDSSLKQFINRFELKAISRALEIIRERNEKDWIIYSDSKIAVQWMKHPRIKWIPREENLAGQYLENKYA